MKLTIKQSISVLTLFALISVSYISSTAQTQLALTPPGSQFALAQGDQQDQNTTVLPPPTNLTATVSGRSVQLSWQAPTGDGASDVVGYIPYRDSLAMPNTTALTATNSSVAVPNTQYCFTVVSVDASGSKSVPTAASCVSFTVGSAISVTDLKATIMSASSVKLEGQYILPAEQWQKLNDPLGFDVLLFIERSLDGGSSWSIIGSVSNSFEEGGSTLFSWTDSTVDTSRESKYRVTAYDSQNKDSSGQILGFSSPSNVAVAMDPQSQPVTPGPTVPAAPSDLVVTIGSQGEATASFKDNSRDETGFIIERQSGSSWSEFHRHGYTNNGSTIQFTLPLLQLSTSYTFRARALNVAGLSDPSNSVTVTMPSTFWSQPVATDHVLVVYNTQEADSVDVKNYYLANRPLFSQANQLGLSFTPPGTDARGFRKVDVDTSVLQNSILKPIGDWLESHPDKQIRYVVLMYGLPLAENGYSTGVGGYGNKGSLDYQISKILQTRGVRNGIEYTSGRTAHFTPIDFQGTTALVTHIEAKTPADTKAYIDKLKNVYNQMQHKDIILSAQDAGNVGTTYYIDFTSQYAEATKNAIMSANPAAQVMYKSTGYFTQASNVRGYATGGSHAGLLRDFAVNGDVVFSGKSNWYVMKTGESFNGQRDYETGSQSSFTQWFAPNAFGGTNYSNTPVGAVAHATEPGASGVNGPELFSTWETGYPFIEGAWLSRNSMWGVTFGDPLVANTGTVPVIVTDTTAPVIQVVSPSGALVSSTTSTTLSITTDENATCRYSTTAGTSYPAMSATPFTTTGGTTHTKAITGLSPGTSYVYYVRCQDTHSNANTTDFSLLFATASASQSAIDNILPAVYMLNPIPGDIFYQSQFELEAAASDSGGIRGVTFYLDEQMVGNEDTTSPYKIVVNVSVGSHSVYAVAYDLAGNMKRSPVVDFSVAQDLSLIQQAPPPIYDPLIIQTPNINYTYNTNSDTQNNVTTNTVPAPVKKKTVQKSLPAELTKNLKLNDSGNEVLLLQRTLNLLGYSISESGKQSLGNENGVFDEATKEALIRYQTTYAESGIMPSGVLDNATLTLINADISQLVADADQVVAENHETVTVDGGSGDSSVIGQVAHLITSFFGYIYNSIMKIFK